MFSKLFDSNKSGKANHLLSLSKKFGATDAPQLTSVAERTIQNLVAPVIGRETQGDLLVQEYLADVAQNTAPPSTFDMRVLLSQLPDNVCAADLNAIKLEQSWADALNTTGNVFAEKWSEEFTSGRDARLEQARNEKNERSIWAKDFLERFDSAGTQRMGGEFSPMAAGWEQEFLSHLADAETTTRAFDQKPMEFFDYESAWDSAHSKEAQERFDFVEANPFLGEQNPLELANYNLSSGRTADSILQYEAALQREPGNPEIWYSLGLALAENEQDPRAISALRNALKLNSRYLGATLALAISLANESFEHLALHELHKWICLYRGGAEAEMPADIPENTSLLFQQNAALRGGNEFSKVERMFLDAVQTDQPGNTAPELQNAMSVLYNLSQDYERAVDCIRAALERCPEDPVLWNRLGATLANADRSAEAINAYKNALQIAPSYVRVRYNLGIACLNLQSYREAALHFLTALQIQHSPEQSQIWTRLRAALIRVDHSEFADGQNLFDALNRRDLPQIAQILGASGSE